MSSTTIHTTRMPRPARRVRPSVSVETDDLGSRADVLAHWAWWIVATAVSTIVAGLGALLLAYAVLDAPEAASAVAVPVVFAAAALPLGLGQSLAMGGRFARGWNWVITWPLAAAAVGALTLVARPDWGTAMHLTVLGALFGAAGAALQWHLVLRYERGRTWLWVPVNALAWAAAGALALQAGMLSGAAAGALTGLPMAWWLSTAGAGRVRGAIGAAALTLSE